MTAVFGDESAHPVLCILSFPSWCSLSIKCAWNENSSSNGGICTDKSQDLCVEFMWSEEMKLNGKKKYGWHYLDLLEGYFKAEWLIVVGVKCVLFNRCLFLLQPLAILHQMNLHIRIWKTETKTLGNQRHIFLYYNLACKKSKYSWQENNCVACS